MPGRRLAPLRLKDEPRFVDWSDNQSTNSLPPFISETTETANAGSREL
jgi:hypothetical protein